MRSPSHFTEPKREPIDCEWHAEGPEFDSMLESCQIVPGGRLCDYQSQPWDIDCRKMSRLDCGLRWLRLSWHRADSLIEKLVHDRKEPSDA